MFHRFSGQGLTTLNTGGRHEKKTAKESRILLNTECNRQNTEVAMEQTVREWLLEEANPEVRLRTLKEYDGLADDTS